MVFPEPKGYSVSSNIEEIAIKAREGATKLLKNCIALYDSNAVLEESSTFQKKMKQGYSKKKKMMIGLGGSKTKGATGLEKFKDFSRAKSAPVGFGVFEEESEEKRKIIQAALALSLRPVAAKGDCAEGTIFRAPTWSCHFNQASSTLIKSFELSFNAFASF